MDTRLDSLNGKIVKLEGELIRYRDQMTKLPEGHPGREAAKRQALQLLQQKKQYEQQRNLLQGQTFNLEQTNIALEGMKATHQTVAVMQQTRKELKKGMGSLRIDRIENLKDDLDEMMIETGEISEVLARSYSTPDYVDEGDLEAELSLLTEFQQVEESPSYLDQLPTPSHGIILGNEDVSGSGAGHGKGSGDGGVKEKANANPTSTPASMMKL